MRILKAIGRSTALAAFALVAYGALSHSNAAHACTYTPDPSQGQVTQSITTPAGPAGTTVLYRVWSRIMAPNLTANSYFLQISGINGGCAYKVGDSSIPANTWTWVDYHDNSSSSKIDVSLAPSTTYTVTYTGDAAGVDVELDRVLFLSDTSCVPTGMGDNCASSDVTPPNASISNPATDGAKVSGIVTINAAAPDDSGSVSSTSFADGSTPITAGATSAYPNYSVQWDTSGLVNGSTHTLTFTATDAAGNTGTATRTVVISNTPTVATITPATATTAGASGIVLTGTNFLTGATVSFGGTAGTGVVVNSPTSITVNAPAHAAGTVDVVVTNPDGKTVTKTGGFTYTTAPKPDLVVTAVLHTPTSPMVGDPITLSATIKNNGTVATAAGTAINVQFKEGTTVLATTAASAGSLAAGATTTIAASTNWTNATAGNHTVVATVDYSNVVPESNETNNTLSSTFAVGILCDTNHDFHVNDTDYFQFLIQYGQHATGLSADCETPYGVVDDSDYFGFLTHWTGP